MSEATRDILTWICLLTLGIAIWYFHRGERTATAIFDTMGSGSADIRFKITLGKRFLVSACLLLFTSLQGWVSLPTEARAFFFIAATDALAISAVFIHRGYARWWDGLKGTHYMRRRATD